MSWDSFEILKNHKVGSIPVYPAAGFLDKLQQIYTNISNINFKNKLTINNNQPEIDIQESNDGTIIWFSNNETILEFNNNTIEYTINDNNFDRSNLISMDINDFYDYFNYLGLEYDKCFKSLTDLKYNDKYVYGTLKIDY